MLVSHDLDHGPAAGGCCCVPAPAGTRGWRKGLSRLQSFLALQLWLQQFEWGTSSWAELSGSVLQVMSCAGFLWRCQTHPRALESRAWSGNQQMSGCSGPALGLCLSDGEMLLQK